VAWLALELVRAVDVVTDGALEARETAVEGDFVFTGSVAAEGAAITASKATVKAHDTKNRSILPPKSGVVRERSHSTLTYSLSLCW